MEGLVFEERSDDAVYTEGARVSNEAFDKEYQEVVAEQSWRYPEKFGHIPASFESHLALMVKRSKELGIVTEYSEELLEIRGRLTTLQGRMMSYDDFYRRVCQCPEEFGVDSLSAANIFGNNEDHEWHPGHDTHTEDTSNPEKNKRKKKKNKESKKLSGLALLGITLKSTR